MGSIPRVSTALNRHDSCGAIKVRLGIGRADYKIPPGLYAVGTPDDKSPVLATANYKLTFDSLRKELDGLNLWIVVLDTKGINVWCAAGKGTFGTAELAGRILALRLKSIITHRTIILPQLGAPGVTAHEIRRLTGFKSVYGPIYACNIKAFLRNGLNATAEMRSVKFDLKDRLILTPIELMHNVRYLLFILLAFLILNLISKEPLHTAQVIEKSLLNFTPYLLAVLTGCVAVPAMLPWLPFRSFALKGLLPGLILAAFTAAFPATFGIKPTDTLMITADILALPVITSFLALNFTGSTTYTSLSGVKKEMKLALPPYIAAASLAAILAVSSRIFQLL